MASYVTSPRTRCSMTNVRGHADGSGASLCQLPLNAAASESAFCLGTSRYQSRGLSNMNRHRFLNRTGVLGWNTDNAWIPEDSKTLGQSKHSCRKLIEATRWSSAALRRCHRRTDGLLSERVALPNQAPSPPASSSASNLSRCWRGRAPAFDAIRVIGRRRS
jgi:hypothetical protein